MRQELHVASEEKRSPKVTRLNVEVDGKRVSYLQDGEGEPVLMLHAWPVSSEMYRPIMTNLSGNLTIAPDFPGFGDSQEPDERLTYDNLTDFTGKFLNEVGVDRSTLLGVSFGGGLALRFAEKHPDRVKKLILNSPPVYFKPHLNRLHRLLLLASDRSRFFKKGMFNGLTNGNEWVFRALWGEGAVGDTEIFRSIYEHSRKMKLSAVDDVLHEIVETDFRDVLSKIEKPTLILAGTRDEDFMPDAILAWEGIKGSSLKFLNDNGHTAVVEQPDMFAKVVDDFLKQ